MMRLPGIFSVLFLFCWSGIIAQRVKSTHADESASLIKFTENKNQWNESVRYRAQLDGGALWLLNGKFIYSFYDKDTYRSMHANPAAKRVDEIKTTGFEISFLNANKNAVIDRSDVTSDYSNYFIGKDPEKWVANVQNFRRLVYKNIWDGIDLELLGKKNSIKYNFYVKAGADPSVINLVYDKVERISLKKNTVRIKTSLNELVEFEPYAFQYINGIKTEVPCNFVLTGKTISYDFPDGYDKSYELVIDPVLVFAASSGSTADNFGMTATYDTLGNLYSGGTCFDNGFPVVNPYDGTYNGVVQYGRTDIVITKYDSSGAFLVYSTYMGGATGSEIVTSLIVDSQNNLYLYGATGSTDFPMAAQAWDNTFNGGTNVQFQFNGTYFNSGTDIYVAKLSAAGNTLLGSTYIGGSDNDGINTNNVIANYVATLYGITVSGEYPPDSLQYNYGDQYRGEIQLDAAGNPVICSSSRSANFPTQNAADNTLGGYQDAVVFKFDQNLSLLQWSTYVGGSNNDAGYALFLAANDEVYFTGGTRSSDFPATAGSYTPIYQGGKCDGYIGKLSASGNSLMAATFIGTSLYDQSYFIQLDADQNAYVFGQSAGSMTVQNVGYSNANGKLFVSKLDSNLSSLVFSTVIGNGTTNITLSPSAFLIDCAENIYLSGWGGNIIMGPGTFNMPLTTGAIQNTTDGFNFYLMVLSKDAQSLLHGTYFGGAYSHEHVDGGTSRFDRKGIIYQSVCAGCGGNDDFPVSPGAWPTSVYGNNWNQSSNCNNGTFKIAFEFTQPQAIFTTSTISGCEPVTVNFTNSSISFDDYLWDFGNGDTSTINPNPTVTYNTPGTYSVTLTALNNSCTNTYDTSITIINVHPLPVASFAYTFDPCSGTYNFSDSSSANITDWSWNFGDGNSDTLQNPVHTYSPGNYSVNLIVENSNGCIDTISQNITVNSFAPSSISTADTICLGDSAQLNATGGIDYQWAPTTGLSNPNSANPVASPAVSTQYSVTIVQVSGGDTCSSVLTTGVTVVPIPQAAFTASSNACSSTYAFTDGSVSNVTSWSWDLGDGSTSTLQNPAHTYGSSGTYTVTLIVSNAAGCKDTTTQTLNIILFPPVTVSADTLICNGNSVQLIATGGGLYQWSPASGLSSTTVANPVASPTTTTQYTVTVTQIAGTDTCVTSLATSVAVSSAISNIFGASANPTAIQQGDSSLLTATFSNGSVVWSPDYNINNPNSPSTYVFPLHTSQFTATYTDTNGCKFIQYVVIEVLAKFCDEATVFVPNTFTPNNDGKNDILFARSNLLTEIYFTVYDRWGQMVFETNDVTKGWDGNFNGKPCNPDVFGYYVKYKCNNGKESFKKGNVTLIR